MKANHLLFSTLILLSAFSFQSCLKDSCERQVTYIRVDPIFKTLEEIHNGTIVKEAPRELKNPGKIYFYNNLIFINERREGIHIIDNADPENPQNIAFVSIPGNEDIAVKSGILLANSYIDLLAIDLLNYTLVSRAENVFPPLWEDLQNNRVAVYYEETPVTEMMDCETFSALNRQNEIFWDCPNCDVLTGWDNSGVFVAEDNNSGGFKNGVGGSMARFTVVGDYLYVVDEANLKVFDLTPPTHPWLANTVSIGWGIETIFPYENKLFIGSNSGMFIFDNTNPTNPVQLSSFAHARACDPVFVKDNYAYVTLRDGTECEGFNNQLDLVDITNILSPVLKASFPMDNPHGLSIKENNLLLCEGANGLKTFDVSDPLTLDQRLLDEVKNIHAFDVISLPGQTNVALIIGDDGFYQYNFDNPSDLKLLSKIPVVK